MKTFHYNINGVQAAVQIEQEAEGYEIRIGDKFYKVVLQKREGQSIFFSIDGVHKQVITAPGSAVDNHNLWMNGQTWTMEKIDPRGQKRRTSAQEGPGALTASMPSQVQEILVAEGDSVVKGAPLIVLEAMKMEMRISAPDDGVVTALYCTIGDVVERGQTLVVLENR